MQLSRFGRRLRDESDFPPPTLRFVGSDVNTVCSSAPIPEEAIWERGGAWIQESTNKASDYEPLYLSRSLTCRQEACLLHKDSFSGNKDNLAFCRDLYSN